LVTNSTSLISEAKVLLSLLTKLQKAQRPRKEWSSPTQHKGRLL